MIIDSPSNKSFTKKYFSTVKDMQETNDIMYNIFDISRHDELDISTPKMSVPIIETKHNFLLDNIQDDQEYGIVKMNTFKEWARLSILDFDKQ